MMSRLMFAAALATVFAAHADARNPIFRYRGNMSQTTTNSNAPARQYAPPTSAQVTSAPAISTTAIAQTAPQADEKMTEVYGPSILDRAE